MVETALQGQRDRLPEMKIPRHIAVILDGNGRWATEKGFLREVGHYEGFGKLESMIRIAEKYGVRYLSVYAFSTENWGRPKPEVDCLMAVFRYYIEKLVPAVADIGGRIRFAGARSVPPLPPELKELMDDAEERTRDRTGIDFIMCINYGGRKEILDAASALLESGHRGPIAEEDLRKYLYCPDVPDPDLVIRTGGDLRLSNFWLWQSAYSEFYFPKEYWPDFSEESFLKALEEYTRRDRRFGKLNK